MHTKNQSNYSFILNNPIGKFSLSFFMGFFVTILSGCAVSGTGPKFELQSTQPTTAIIYHYRLDAFKGSAMSYDVLSNRRPLTRIGNGGFFKEIVSPREIEYRTKLTQDHGVLPGHIIINYLDNLMEDFEVAYKLNPKAGNRYFLKWTTQIFESVPKIESVPEDIALKEIANLRSFSPLTTQPPQ